MAGFLPATLRAPSASKIASCDFVNSRERFQIPPRPKKKKAPTSCKGLFFLNLVGVRGLDALMRVCRTGYAGARWNLDFRFHPPLGIQIQKTRLPLAGAGADFFVSGFGRGERI